MFYITKNEYQPLANHCNHCEAPPPHHGYYQISSIKNLQSKNAKKKIIILFQYICIIFQTDFNLILWWVFISTLVSSYPVPVVINYDYCRSLSVCACVCVLCSPTPIYFPKHFVQRRYTISTLFLKSLCDLSPSLLLSLLLLVSNQLNDVLPGNPQTTDVILRVSFDIDIKLPKIICA